jgi:hypothetical protein
MQYLYLLSFIIPPIVACFYKCKFKILQSFARRMTLSFHFRALYAYLMTLYLLAFHFWHLTVMHRPYCLLPSTVLIIMLTCSVDLSERIFRFLQHNHTFIAVCFAGLFGSLVPELLPLCYTMIVLAVAAMFYPSRYIMDDFNKIALWKSSPDAAYEKYFRWHPNEVKSEVKPEVDVKILDIIQRFNKSKISPNAIEDADYVDLD